MSKDIKITRITNTSYDWGIDDMRWEEKIGFDYVYHAGSHLPLGGSILTVETNAGVRAELPGGMDERSARYLLGRNPLDREIIWHEMKRSQRGSLNSPPGYVDAALWDIAGKLYDAPVWELLGGWKKKLPCYASTYHGDENGGLDSPQAFAEFALQCKEQFGYPAFKIHGWVDGPIQREVDSVLAIRAAVGPEMDLMLDPAGAFGTFSDVLAVGKACDEANYYWYEDGFRGGGTSQFAHSKLRDFIKTPLLTGEHIRGLEGKADCIVNRAADYVRASVGADGGITGVMKIAALAESFGLDVELHGPGVNHRHCMGAIRNTNYFELGLVHPLVKNDRAPVYEDPQFLDGIDCVDENGCVDVPDGPGLGVPVNWDFVNARKTGETVFEA